MNTAQDIPDKYQRQMAIWLFACMVMVLCMVTVGGLTRLTGSGLSMTDWHPIHGVIPPMSVEEWEEEFNAYRDSPEYQKINKGMSLDGFKQIFYVEYFHRILGRLTGFVFFIPMMVFFFRGHIRGRLRWQLPGIFLLGGLQGVIGWYMVKSGLVDDPRVSPYRLTLHLMMAFLIFGLLLWKALRLWYGDAFPHPSAPKGGLRVLSFWVIAAVLTQIALGGLVAGNDAGLTYNTFPLMDGQLVPEGLWLLEPAWRNLTENVTMVQFNHRLGALILMVLFVAYIFLALKQCQQHSLRKSLYVLIVLFVLQVLLGIKTLLLAVPVALASLHQVVALLLFGQLLFMHFHLCAVCSTTIDRQPS